MCTYHYFLTEPHLQQKYAQNNFKQSSHYVHMTLEFFFLAVIYKYLTKSISYVVIFVAYHETNLHSPLLVTPTWQFFVRRTDGENETERTCWREQQGNWCEDIYPEKGNKLISMNIHESDPWFAYRMTLFCIVRTTIHSKQNLQTSRLPKQVLRD